jgi:spermidine synthase
MLFAAPGILLGMVAPFAARLQMTAVANSGSTVGSLYALSTLGSIAGTFAAGFWLIPVFGSGRLLLALAAVLMVCSALAAPYALRRARAGALLLSTASALWGNSAPRLPSGRVVLDRDTPYQRLVVFDLPVPGRQPVRVLSTGFAEYQSAMLLDRPGVLALDYARFFRLALRWRPGLRRALCIGGGALSYPRDILQASPETRIDVVELDPAVTQTAQLLFGMTAHPLLALHHEDGRVFLNRAGPVYDAIFLDVFRGRTVPFHLATVESARRLAARLTPEGVLMVNMFSAIEGPAGRFFRAEYATLRQVFPQVLVFAVFYPDAPLSGQNLVLAATRSRVPLPLDGEAFRSYAAHLWRHPITPDEPVLTDDRAPVELYTALQFTVAPAR